MPNRPSPGITPSSSARPSCRRAAALAAGLALALVGSAGAQTTSALTTEVVVSGLARPVLVTHAPGDDDRLFIVEAFSGTTGRIRIYKKSTGALLATPFLSVSPVSNGSEQGLLGLAFHPDYQSNGLFYVNFTNSAGDTVIRRYAVSANPDVADPASAQQVLFIDQPFTNHNGGNIVFGPDGYLYLGMGDGGSGNDPLNSGQTRTSLLGKMLRIDVDGDDFPADPDRNYAIPPSNPFFGSLSTANEIWALGTRNPWRWSFDRLTGELYMGDVGQNAWEEINVQPPGMGGLNYGWRCMEGLVCTGLSGCTCNGPDLTLPVHVYGHTGGFCWSVTGGHVYRGLAIPDLRGTYFFADYCLDKVWSFRYALGVKTDFKDRSAELDPPGTTTLGDVSSFGEDASGELYIAQLTGQVLKVVPVCYPDCDQSTGPGVLDFFDFVCFQDSFSMSEPYADCDVSTGNGVFDFFDFICFQDAFGAGC